jgi:hypothetical protein
MGVEEAGVDEAFGDAFFAGEELLAIEATEVRTYASLSSWALLQAMCVPAVASNTPQCPLRLVRNRFSDESRP